jgi:hypothetical protein
LLRAQRDIHTRAANDVNGHPHSKRMKSPNSNHQ